MPKQLNKFLIVITFFVSLLAIQSYAQYEIPKVPSIKEQTSLYDYGKVLTPQQQNELKQKLINYSDSTSTQIVVITIPSLQGEDISLLGPEWGQRWGIGQKDKGNGVVILMAVQERKIGIYPGYGAEVQITAGQGGELIRNQIIPEFKKGDYYAGLNAGVNGVFEMLTGNYRADKARMEGDNEIGGFICLALVIILFIAIGFMNKNKKGNGGNRNSGNRNFAGDLMDLIVLSSLGRGSGGGGGFGSGGGFGGGGGGFSGGFGGGGFSGGGSSGSW